MAAEVVIDGVPYVPLVQHDPGLPSVGIGITTLDRPQELKKTLDAIRRHTPAEFGVVVVDDGSKKPVKVPSGVRLIRNDEPGGIPAAKNACIAALMEAGVDHLFLFDDDTRPVCDDWWRPYVESPEPHLQYSWLVFAKDGRPVPAMAELYRDEHLVGYSWSMGCMLYVHRSVVDRIGGMRTEFGRGFEEHAEFGQRAHNVGLTTFVHQDVVGSEKLIYAADEHYAVQRSFTGDTDREARLARNIELRESLADSTDFVEYRAARDIVLTSFFVGHDDPQYPQLKGGRRPVPAEIEPLITSVGKEDVVLLHNHDAYDALGCETHKVECPWSPYQYRWLAQWRYLRDHPEVDMCWLTDAADVEMLRDPFPHMRPDVLFVGWENVTLDCQWIRDHCPDGLVSWVDENSHLTLLNTGIVGSQRRVLLELCRRMVDLWVSSEQKDPLTEMAQFNYVVRTMDVELVTGPRVTTLFKAEQDNGYAFWRHK